MAVSLARHAGLDTDDASELERTWVARAQAGDPIALDWLVRRHSTLVERLLHRILGRRQDMDDLIQNTFVETLRALPSFRGESGMSSFVAGIAVRVARRALRPALVARFRSDLHEEELFAEDGLADAQLEAQRRLGRVRAALARLAEPKRVAFLLWALEGLPPERIADMMEASLSATRSRIYHAQKELLARASKDPVLREWLLERSHEHA
jgi:RNA polymerase sigma-70 factor (ECF subfamily)